jgi:hypothetical protein
MLILAAKVRESNNESILSRNRSYREGKYMSIDTEMTTMCATAAASGCPPGSLTGLSGNLVFGAARRPEDSEVSRALAGVSHEDA